MKTKKKEKSFDTVKMMRDIRDRLSVETENMTFQQLKDYIAKKLAERNMRVIGE